MDISVVIPVYNERHRLPDNLTAVMHYLKSKFAKSEIIVVEDGSDEKVEEHIKSLPSNQTVSIQYISHHPNRGKGYSVRRGVLEATGELIACIDADGATPIHEMDRLLDAINKGADIAIGSRNLESEDIKVEKSFHRFVMGMIFTFIVKTIVGIDFKDTQCGFKLYKKETAHNLYSQLKTEGYAFDVEILARAKKKGYTTKELGVNWHDVAGSKVHLLYDSWQMFIDVYKISNLLKENDKAR